MKKNLQQLIAASVLLTTSGVASAEHVNIGAPAWTGAQAIAHLSLIHISEPTRPY